jgi:hypothetical protein
MTELDKEIQTQNWSQIKESLKSSKVLIIPYNQDFYKTAKKLKISDEHTILDLMNSNSIVVPNQQQVKNWDLLPNKEFKVIKIGDYLYAQEVLKKHF